MSALVRLPGRAEPVPCRDPGWAAAYPPPCLAQRLRGRARRRRPGLRVDWDATLGFRDHLWAHGFGVAEAMDTAQRGMGLAWDQARELISAVRGRARPSSAPCSPAAPARTSWPTATHPLRPIIRAYEEQLALVRAAGAGVILMASRALAAARPRPPRLPRGLRLRCSSRRTGRSSCTGSAIPSTRRCAATGAARISTLPPTTVLELIDRAGGQVDGIKLSLLDAGREVALRRRLPPGVRMYTGDDFNYAELIRGDERAQRRAARRLRRRSPRPPPRRCTRWTRATSPATTRP